MRSSDNAAIKHQMKYTSKLVRLLNYIRLASLLCTLLDLVYRMWDFLAEVGMA